MTNPVKAPTFKQLFTLRFLIISGTVYMFFFIGELLSEGMMANEYLYYALLFVIIFYCLKIIHEWIHYLFITVPKTPPATKTYTVDIFTTFCAGEPYDMIKETLEAIKAIKYPHETYLCDEADDPYLRQLCADLDIRHVTRKIKVNAKAGNINNALQRSSGELCVVLDPDHVPQPDFLDPIVSHFDNPSVGFVQVVQAYKNSRDNLIAKGAAQQTFQFYGPIMMTMNRYGTVLAIGANCTFRRTALDSIGGHAAGLAEDMNTAMHLHAKGWKSVYVPAVLARGLVPDTLSAYYSQQLKWSRGVFELLVTSYIKLFRGFTWQQKLHYGVIPLHYFSGLVFLANFMIPVFSLLFLTSPINLDIHRFAMLGFPFLTSVILIRHFVQNWVMEDDERGFHMVGGLLMIGTWWVFITGFVYTILRKKVPYVPTPKDGKEDNNWILNVPNLAVIAITLASIVYALSQDISRYTLYMAGFGITNCFILSFSVAASRQLHFRRFKVQHEKFYKAIAPISYVKNRFWKARHAAYTSVHRIILPVALCIAFVFMFFKLEPIRQQLSTRMGKTFGTRATSISMNMQPVISAGILQSLKRPPTRAANPNNLIFSPEAKGVTYSKGKGWLVDYNGLTWPELKNDFAEMRNMGLHTLNWYGNQVFDGRVLEEAAKNNLSVKLCFWIPDDIDYVSDSKQLKKFESVVVESIKRLKGNNTIVAWQLSNNPVSNDANQPQIARSVYGQSQYLRWLKQLVKAMKMADPARPITVDLPLNSQSVEISNMLANYIPQISSFGLIVKDLRDSAIINKLQVPFFYDAINVRDLMAARLPERAAFLSNWQDEYTSEYVTFDGLKDRWGNKKAEYYIFENRMLKRAQKVAGLRVKILKPAIPIYPGIDLTYNALIYSNQRWHIPENEPYQYKWSLVSYDEDGVSKLLKVVGTGKSLSLKAPSEYKRYRLYLYTYTGDTVYVASSQLHTPLR